MTVWTAVIGSSTHLHKPEKMKVSGGTSRPARPSLLVGTVSEPVTSTSKIHGTPLKMNAEV